MKKVLIGVCCIAALLWLISQGNAEAVGWGFGLIIGAFLAIVALRALFFTAGVTGAVAITETAKALTKPTPPPSLPPTQGHTSSGRTSDDIHQQDRRRGKALTEHERYWQARAAELKRGE